jgi:hypothetical protein
MKTITELELENAELNRLIEKKEQQLQIALDEVARNYAEKIGAEIETKKRGEFHHRAFATLCPAPDLSQITIFK